MVGDGSTIDIWEDPWVPSLPAFRTLTQGARGDDDPKMVNELMNGRVWDVGKLNKIFTAWEVNAIMRIPIPRYHEGDE